MHSHTRSGFSSQRSSRFRWTTSHAVLTQQPSERTLAMSAAVNVMSLIPADSTSGRVTKWESDLGRTFELNDDIIISRLEGGDLLDTADHHLLLSCCLCRSLLV